MTLAPGGTLLHYRIVEKLGEGGMGEVWKAVDTTLDREVAIKLLPTDSAADADRLARFEREAKLLASLNHPHIAAIHGLHADGEAPFLAMELVAGEDLEERLRRGPLRSDEALKVARQLSAALEAAHRAGVIHRDLKPANIRLGANGDVKVLDFGLAKALAPEAAGGAEDPAQSPTVTSLGTIAGVILGTAAYMAPEQARGHEVDERADIWAFGVVLYEMLTGRPLFADKSVSDTMAAVLTREPDWDAVPFPVRRLLQACMEKERDQRLRSIADVWLLLDEEPEEVGQAGASRGLFGIAALATALVVGALVTAASLTYLRPENSPATTTFREYPPAVGRFAHPPTPSPDGAHLAMVVRGDDGSTILWVRSFDELEARRLDGTEGAGLLVAWSPDSQEIAFRNGDDILRVSRDGGPTRLVGTVPGAIEAVWLDDGDLLVSSASLGPVFIAASGGAPRIAAGFADLGNVNVGPGSIAVVPHRRQVFYYRVGKGWGTYVAPLDGSAARRLDLREFSRLRPLDSGYVLLQREGRLQARRYDPAAMHFVGEAIHVADNVEQYEFDAGRSGTIAFLEFEHGTDRIVRLDRDGVELEELSPAANYAGVEASPTGPQYGYVRFDPDILLPDVWLRGFGAAAASLVANDPRVEHGLVFSTDGAEALWEMHSDNGSTFLRRPTDRSREAEAVDYVMDESGATVTDWHDDLLFYTAQADSTDLWAISTSAAAPQPIAVLNSAADEHDGRVSADGRWLAFRSNEDGRAAVYVQRIDGARVTGGAIRVSREEDGVGWAPKWSASDNGYQLYYKAGPILAMTGAKLMVVDVPAEGDRFTPQPRELFHVGGLRGYDPMPDGRTFLAIMRQDRPPRPAVVIRNWRPDGR